MAGGVAVLLKPNTIVWGKRPHVDDEDKQHPEASRQGSTGLSRPRQGYREGVMTRRFLTSGNCPWRRRRKTVDPPDCSSLGCVSPSLVTHLHAAIATSSPRICAATSAFVLSCAGCASMSPERSLWLQRFGRREQVSTATLRCVISGRCWQ